MGECREFSERETDGIVVRVRRVVKKRGREGRKDGGGIGHGKVEESQLGRDSVKVKKKGQGWERGWVGMGSFVLMFGLVRSTSGPHAGRAI
jgi:hypothetical protein